MAYSKNQNKFWKIILQYHIFFVTLQSNIKKIEEIKMDAKEEERSFREKANHYLVCFVDNCPLHEQCLRWLVGQYVSTTLPAYNAVNPRNPKNGGEHCAMFRKKQRVMMKRGMINFYHDMPGHIERAIRASLIAAFGRKQYFEMRKGTRLITPDHHQYILDVCRHHGWQGPLAYDGEQEEWMW